MITRQHIRQFLAVVETGSFTRAAEKIGIAQPSLSSGIRQLEEQVGTQLFDRHRPTVRLTSAANRLLPIARRIDREFKRAEVETSNPVSDRHAFALGVIPSISTAILAHIFSADSGLISLREKPARELLRELRKGTIDAALTVLTGQTQEDLHVTELWSEPYMLMVSDNHPIATMSHIEAEETANEAMMARRSCEYLSETSKFFTDRGVRPRFSFKSRNDDRVMAMVAAGLGITIAPKSLVRGGVCAIELADFNSTRTIGLLARGDDYKQTGRYRKRIDELADLLGEAAQIADLQPYEIIS